MRQGLCEVKRALLGSADFREGRARRWWTGRDLNPQGLLHQILSLARLPISPPVRDGGVH